MKKILIALLTLILFGVIFSFYKTSHKSTSTEDLAYIAKNSVLMTHEDSIHIFIEWYTAMCEEILSSSDIEDFKKIGPSKIAGLQVFSDWHIKISDYDRKYLKDCFKTNFRRIIPHSAQLMNESGLFTEKISQAQIDFMIELGERGTDLAIDTTTYLDYFVRWSIDNYNPPIITAD